MFPVAIILCSVYYRPFLSYCFSSFFLSFSPAFSCFFWVECSSFLSRSGRRSMCVFRSWQFAFVFLLSLLSLSDSFQSVDCLRWCWCEAWAAPVFENCLLFSLFLFSISPRWAFYLSVSFSFFVLALRLCLGRDSWSSSPTTYVLFIKSYSASTGCDRKYRKPRGAGCEVV